MSQTTPTIAIVGRPNVGKSTLFNRLIRARKAIVDDQSGVTLDRHYAYAEHQERRFLFCDTGGFSHEVVHPLQTHLNEQVEQAIMDADLVLWVVSAQEGITPLDNYFHDFLRKQNKPFVLAANKAESARAAATATEFSEFGHDVYSLSAEHNLGMEDLWSILIEKLPKPSEVDDEAIEDETIDLAIIGRPNVGKSTLLNQWLGEERAIVSDIAGTTRDTMSSVITYQEQDYRIVDTAGLRRKSNIKLKSIERYAVLRTLQAIEECHVALLMLNAKEGMTEQDARLLSHILSEGRSLVIAINQWDHINAEQKTTMDQTLDHRLRMHNFPIDMIKISAKYGTRVSHLFPAIKKAYISAKTPMKTHTLTQWLLTAQTEHPPPLHQGRTIRMRYAHPAGTAPPHIIIHGKKTNQLSDTYKRYLQGFFSKKLQLTGTPVRLGFRQDDNPFDPKKQK
jgi:GTPase